MLLSNRRITFVTLSVSSCASTIIIRVKEAFPMKTRKQIRPFPILLILLILILAGSILYYGYSIERINQNFNADPQYSDWNLNKTDTIMNSLVENGFDMTVPGIDGNISFTVPRNMTYYNHSAEQTLYKGDVVTTDFATYSSRYMYRSTRAAMFTVNGKEQDVRLKASDMARLYAEALEQNGLTERFEAEFGQELTYRNARDALRTIDRQLYEKGVTNPMDYPFDKYFWKGLIEMAAYLAPFSLLVLSIFVSFVSQSLKYRAFLKEYNTENIALWDDIAGTLPQFQSLKNSGMNMALRTVVQKPTLLNAIINLFKPI